MRNFDIFDWNGPDMRFTTLEDIYGTTGNTFQAAVGFLNFETTNSTQDPPSATVWPSTTWSSSGARSR